MLTKQEFKSKYGVSRQEMFVLVSLLMERDLYKLNLAFLLEGAKSKNEVTKKIIKRLIHKRCIQPIGNSNYYTLTNDGFLKAYNKIKEFDGKICNAPLKTQKVLKNDKK